MTQGGVRLDHAIAAILLLGVCVAAIQQADILLLVVAAPFIGAFLLVRESTWDTVPLGQLTIPAFFIILYAALMALPAMWMTPNLTEARYTYVAAVFSVLVALPVGVLIADQVFPQDRMVARTFLSSVPPSDARAIPRATLYVSFLLGIAGLALYVYYSRGIPLLESMRGGGAGPSKVDLRFAENLLPESVQFAYEMSRRLLLPFAMLFALLAWRVTARGSWLLAFLPLFALSVIGSALALDRAPAFTVVVMVLLASLVTQGASVRRLIDGRVLALLAAASVIGGFISIFQYRGTFSVELLANTAWYVATRRVFQDAAYMASLTFSAYTDPSTLLFGKSMRLLSYLGFESVPAPPSGFVADLWRNFGWPGVVLGSVLLGFVMHTVQVKVFRVASIPTHALYVITIVGFAWLIYGNALGTVTTAVPALAIAGAALIGGWKHVRGTRRGRVAPSRST